jgi:hypothetical protein
MRLEPGTHTGEVDQTAHEHARSSEKNDGQRDLENRECVARTSDAAVNRKWT